MNSTNQTIKYLIDNRRLCVDANTGIIRNRDNKIIEVAPDDDGYLRVRCKEANHIAAHKIAAYAYYGAIALHPGLVVSFHNYNRRDIRKCNLQVITRQELQQKAKWHGNLNFMVYDEERSVVIAAFECEEEAVRYSMKRYRCASNVIEIKWRL